MGYYDDAELSPYEEGWEDGYDGLDTENPFYYWTQAYLDYEYGYQDGDCAYLANVFRHYGYT